VTTSMAVVAPSTAPAADSLTACTAVVVESAMEPRLPGSPGDLDSRGS
jgi:hypothetical protein